MDWLIELERALHSPDTRKDSARLKQLLHKDFQEVGASGSSYDFQSICSLLQSEQPSQEKVISRDFQVITLTQDAYLLLYNSCLLPPENTPHSFAKRSSVWVKNRENWQIRYHQGTPCAAFSLVLNPK